MVNISAQKLLIAGLFVTLIAVVFWQLFLRFNLDAKPQALKSTRNQQELINSYEREVQAILQRFVVNFQAVGAPDEVAIVKDVREKLLTLTVPSRYKDFHLSLILSLNEISDGLLEDRALTAAGVKRFNELIQGQPWLNISEL